MVEDFARVLREKLLQDVLSEKDALSRGALKDFSEYKYHCGVVRGLELANQHVQDLIAAVREADDF